MLWIIFFNLKNTAFNQDSKDQHLQKCCIHTCIYQYRAGATAQMFAVRFLHILSDAEINNEINE